MHTEWQARRNPKRQRHNNKTFTLGPLSKPGRRCRRRFRFFFFFISSAGSEDLNAISPAVARARRGEEDEGKTRNGSNDTEIGTFFPQERREPPHSRHCCRVSHVTRRSLEWLTPSVHHQGG